MRHRTKTDSYGSWIKLVKKTNPKTGRRHYSVILDAYGYYGSYPNMTSAQYATARDDWRAHFDPGNNRGMKTALSFKFGSKQEAEQLIIMALLKWGERHVAN